jgi:hypothetical protein
MKWTGHIPPVRAAALVLLAAAGTYANSLPNGFAFDDNTIIRGHPVVTEGRVADALRSSYWPEVAVGAGLYRPVTLASYALEWKLWDGRPVGFHAANVITHAAVSGLVFLLILGMSSVLPALVGGMLFAVHPVHSEAVANVVGRAELYAALFVVGACLAFRWRGMSPGARGVRLLLVGALYSLGLGSKEMAATLPALLVLLVIVRDDDSGRRGRLWSDMPIFVLTGTVLVAFLAARLWTLGSVAGDVPASYLMDVSAGERILTALSVWPHYFRLLVFPMDLVADYAPAVLFPALTWGPDVILGLAMILVGIAVAVRLRSTLPLVSTGIVWFMISILPVTNFLFPTGVMLAERTLYLPSVGLAFVAAGVVVWAAERRRESLPALLMVIAVVCAVFMTRTVLRNPSWMSTFAMLSTLTEEHPESIRAIRSRARGLDLVGETDEAARHYEVAVELVPNEYSLLIEAARFYGRQEEWTRAEPLLRHAVDLFPDLPAAWQVLSEQRLNQGRGQEAHRIALQGLAIVGADTDLWRLVSESYVTKRDYEAAIRARRASFAAGPETSAEWRRMAELMELAGLPEEAGAAVSRADRLARSELLAGPPAGPPAGPLAGPRRQLSPRRSSP